MKSFIGLALVVLLAAILCAVVRFRELYRSTKRVTDSVEVKLFVSFDGTNYFQLPTPKTPLVTTTNLSEADVLAVGRALHWITNR